jgi:CheY-like chemotaxis protein
VTIYEGSFLLMQSSFQRSNLKILLAEDNIVNQKILLKQLSKLGYDVESVANGQEAVGAIARQHYDIVLMDCQMPVLDGYDATQQIRQMECRAAGSDRDAVIIIALTANAMSEDYDRAIAVGMNDYLRKPISQAILEETLDSWGQRLINWHPATTVRPSCSWPTDFPLSTISRDLEIQIDWQHLSKITEGSPGFELDLLQIFIRDNQGRVESLRQSIQSGNARQVEHLAHYIKGASANVGAHRIQSIADCLEQQARHHNLAESDQLLLQIHDELQQIQAFLSRSAGDDC